MCALHNKKKILFIIPSLARGGGAERVASELSKRLSRKYELCALTFTNVNDFYSFDGDVYSLSENYSFPEKYIHFLKRTIKIYKIITYISPDLIISFMEIANTFSILTKVVFQLKIPLIISVHCNPEIVYQQDMKYFKILIRLFYPLKVVYKIITISYEVSTILVSRFNLAQDKIITIHNGIDIKQISHLKEKRLDKYQNIFNDNNLLKYITIGRLEELKGHASLIEAFYDVKKKIPNSKLIIIGEGSLKRLLKEQIEKLQLNNDVILTGYIKNPFKYISKADIFVLSSYYEGLPMVLLEALACELPIISTDCPTGPREILGNNEFGILVGVKNLRELTMRMIELGNNKELRMWLKKKSLIRAKAFDYKIVEQQWIKLIESS